MIVVNLLRPRNLYAENRLDFIHMRRVIHAITATFNLGDDAHVHITLLRQFLLG